MKKLIKKYTILLITGLILARLLSLFIAEIWPEILIRNYDDGSFRTYSVGNIEMIIEYFVNVVFIFLIYFDLKKQEIKSAPILIITFFSCLAGVLFFLLVTYQKKLNLIIYRR